MKCLIRQPSRLVWSLLWTVSVLADETNPLISKITPDVAKSKDFFTLIVLPDTQGYADTRHRETQKHWPEIGDQRACFYGQTEWIKKNHRARNIVMVAHVGDITQTEHDDEWKIADAAFKTIEPHVPYLLCSHLLCVVDRESVKLFVFGGGPCAPLFSLPHKVAGFVRVHWVSAVVCFKSLYCVVGGVGIHGVFWMWKFCGVCCESSSVVCGHVVANTDGLLDAIP